MNKKDEQIEQKLIQLEASIDESQHKALIGRSPGASPASGSSSDPASLVTTPTTSAKQDFYYVCGIGLLLLGILMLFNHIRVGTGMFAALGMGSGGFGLVLIPLLVGLGWMMYDSKNKIGWAITALSIALIFFSALSSLIMMFPSVTLLGLILMLLPFAAGGALLLKGMGGPKGVEQKLREERLIK
jgi:hypothetical protein